jgi:hypothetical protein
MRHFFTLCFVAVLLAGCMPYLGYPVGKVRYKVTMEVMTPEGLRTGYSVNEFSASGRPPMLGEQQTAHYKPIHTEAVAVDLGQRGFIFMLAGVNPYYLVFNAIPPQCTEGYASKCGAGFYATLPAGSGGILDPDDYPQLVHFKNMKDYRSVEIVSKYADKPMPDAHGGFARSFEDVFGKGVYIHAIRVEITKEPLTHKIDAVLPAYPPRRPLMTMRDRAEFPYYLERSSFTSTFD